MAETVRVGVIGTGIGVAHVEALRRVPGAAVVAICSAQRARAEAVAARFGLPRATDDYRDLLGPDVDAVVVAAPPALHAPLVRDALAAGKHVFCEKPLAASLAEARALRDAARAAGVVHMVNFQLRFAAPYARAHELMEEDYLGPLAVADARMIINPVDYLRSADYSDSKAGWFTDAARAGGLLASSAGPHLADLLLWYGGEVAAVAARTAVSRPAVALAAGREVRDITAEDTALGLVRFVSGALATVRGLPVAYHGSGFALELHGLRGSLAVGGGTLLGGSALYGATAEDTELRPLSLPADTAQDRVVIAERFVAAIQSGGPSPAPNFDDGVAAQALLDALGAAAREHRWVAVEQS
ncbi:MAG TPA: Gfo/Idh/MocA family oxidoreductase [Thermomicrobiales bacterium]|nr:Gfo/Idh/MocA family oxidoreductase [Thermomicrobiales bacterium]